MVQYGACDHPEVGTAPRTSAVARLMGGILLQVRIDGHPPGPAHGLDVDDQGNGTVTEQRLYQLIRQPQPIEDRQFNIEFRDAGVEAFVFAFG